MDCLLPYVGETRRSNRRSHPRGSIQNIREVLEMVIEDLLEHGMPIPELPEEAVMPPEEQLAVTL